MGIPDKKSQKLLAHIMYCINSYAFKMYDFKTNHLFFQVIDHYENPRNVGSLDKEDSNVGTGLVGAPACGDVMKLQVHQGIGSGLVI